jgi:hypothetical protein
MKNLTLTNLKYILYDARFIRSIEIIKEKDNLKAIYMVRLLTGWGLSTAKKYIDRLDRFKTKMRNPLQYE